MTSRSPRQQAEDKKESFSKQVKAETAGLQVKKAEDKRSLASGIIMPGTAIRDYAAEVLGKCRDELNKSNEKISLDPKNGARLFLRGVFLSDLRSQVRLQDRIQARKRRGGGCHYRHTVGVRYTIYGGCKGRSSCRLCKKRRCRVGYFGSYGSKYRETYFREHKG